MSQIEFKAPGPGAWELEQTHFGRPATRYMSTLVSDPLARGFAEGTKRYGLLLDHFRMRFVNDFCYGKFVAVGAPEGAVGPPPKLIFMLLTRLHPEIRRRIAAAPDGHRAEAVARGPAPLGRGGQAGLDRAGTASCRPST